VRTTESEGAVQEPVTNDVAGEPAADGDARPGKDGTDRAPRPADVAVVVPARNAEGILTACLESIVEQGPAELIVVDGLSTDRTVEIARAFGAQVLSDEGRGLPAARSIGARAATTRAVVLVDADVILPPGSLEALLREFHEGGYTALQAGLESESGPGYWGQALAHHHRTGLSRHWFGLVATVFDREALLSHGFDDSFESGEDIELRWRLARVGAKAGVSRTTIVRHRFEDRWDFARGQFRADGRGLARMVRKHRLGGARLLLLPGAAGARGVVLSLVRREPRWIPYYVAFAALNYSAMIRELLPRRDH
jgi:glycosyltransferase involved in cell wall biosynthesis